MGHLWRGVCGLASIAGLVRFLGFLVVALAFGAPPEGGAGALASTGEALGAAVVTGVEAHPEYERYAIRQPDGRVAVAELTTGAGGLCDAGGLTIFPRADLSGVNETVGMAELCARLEARKPSLRARIGPDAGEGSGARQPGDAGPDGEPPAEGAPGPSRAPGAREVVGPPRVTPIHLALMLLAALALPRVRVDRMLAGVTLAALAARVWASPWGIGNGNLAGYEKLVLARGTLENPPYGEGWGALMGAVPGWPSGVFAADLVYAVLSVPLLAALVRREAGARAGLAAGLLFALLPAHIGVSATETMHVPLVAFELLAVLAAGAFARSGEASVGVIAALATGVAVHLRPDALPFVAVPVAWAAWGVHSGAVPWRRALLPGAVLAGLVGWRVATLGGSPGAGLLQLPGLDVLVPRVGEPVAAGSFQLFLHAGFTPPVAWGLAAIGIAVLLRDRHRGLLALLLAWIAVTTLPYSAKVWPLVDAVRLQLAGQAPWLALAGIGAAALPRWVLPVALLTFFAYLPVRPWVQTEEWQFLAKVVPELPPGAVVRYDPRPQRAASFAAVMEAVGPARWSPDAGDYRYVGLDCLAQGGCDTSGCVAWRVTRLEGKVDLDLALTDRTIGLWRCDDAIRPAP
ncbi:MAG: hypothetical protein Q8P41_05720 [Pseudomonadota bacterium]|nr:hypothetical protein [Pseudomonadota bacterium]